MRRPSAFTLVETIVVVGIIIILATLVFKFSPDLLNKFGKARCLSNMRNLHVALSSYVQDHSMWPQAPEATASNGQKYEDWWMAAMDPYLDTRKAWVCPVLERGKIALPSGQLVKMHYMPTKFDANRISPFRWSTQPWLIEIANAHGDGGLILFPDGSIQSLGQILSKKK